MRVNILVIILVLIGLLLFFYNPDTINTSSNKLITTNMTKMIPLLASDPKIEESNDNYVRVSYLFYFGYDAMELKCEIIRSPTIEEAQGNYSSIKQQYLDVQNVGLGNEGFGFEKNGDSVVIFRKNNIIVKTELSGRYTSLDQTINYAKNVEKKII